MVAIKYYQSTQVSTAAVKMGEVKKGNIVETISATGALSAQDNVDISSKITGRIVEVLVKENQHVTPVTYWCALMQHL